MRPIRSQGEQRQFTALADNGRSLVRGYLAEWAACAAAANGDDDDDCRAAGIDLFESSRQWCPEPPPLAVEDAVSAEISSFLVGGRTKPIAEPWLSRIGSDEEVTRANDLVKQAESLLRAHRRLLGHPTRSPFLPGGRRVMIRALATAEVLMRVQDSPPVEGSLHRAPLPWHAWCAIAHLVFQELGPEAAARHLLNLDNDASVLNVETYQRLEKLTAALRQANVAEVAALIAPPSQPAVKRRSKATAPRRHTAADNGPATSAAPRKARG